MSFQMVNSTERNVSKFEKVYWLISKLDIKLYLKFLPNDIGTEDDFTSAFTWTKQTLVKVKFALEQATKTQKWSRV